LGIEDRETDDWFDSDLGSDAEAEAGNDGAGSDDSDDDATFLEMQNGYVTELHTNPLRVQATSGPQVCPATSTTEPLITSNLDAMRSSTLGSLALGSNTPEPASSSREVPAEVYCLLNPADQHQYVPH
ncbi:hypothetical protein Hypma_005702, partial [Hypsizygus marmoreus]